MGHYHTAQVCLNGHPITESIQSSPGRTAKRCGQCGAETTTKCPKCQTALRGYYDIPDVYDFEIYYPPAFCHECGEPYPWTERHLTAVRELIDLEASLSAAEKDSIKEDLANLMVDTPRTKVAAAKMGQFLKKAGQEVGSAGKEILVEIGSEAAKKILFPGN